MQEKIDRVKLRSEYTQQRGSVSTQMNEDELQAQHTIDILRKELLYKDNLNPYSRFFDNREKFHNSRLFKTLKKMPKGVIQHLHNPAGADINLFYELSKDKRVFIDLTNNVLKVLQTEKDTIDNCERLSCLVEKIGMKKVKEKINKRIIFDEEKFNGSNTRDIFEGFAQAFDSLFVGYYEPFFKPLIESTFSTLKKDNVQAVELRNVFGIMQREKDQSAMKFEEELDFQQKVFEEVSKHYNMPYKLYHCGLKNLGEKNVIKSLNQYLESRQTHPGFINGYDIVHYEEYMHINQVYDQLEKAKDCDHNINYCFHAGESLNPQNFNVIDSIALGCKRIGHGLQVANSSYLIDLVKKQDVCVEINPLSNYMLGYVRDLENHPAKILIQSGVKITISPDDYIIFGELGTTMDFMLSVVYFQFDLRDLKWCLQNSIDYSVFSQDEKKEIQKKFDEEWEKFIKYVLTINQVILL